MIKGGYREASGGFTVVETMIVLAVTGVLFVSAAIAINGRQNKTEFTTAINSLQQQLQQVINETASGYYPNTGTFTCKGDSTGTGPVTFNTTANKQGANGGCIFMGKAMQFGLGTDADASTLGVLPLVGNQYLPSSFDPILTVTDTRPRAVVPGLSEVGISGFPNTSSVENMEYGLTVATANNTCGVAFNSGICYFDNASGSLTPLATGIVAFMSGDSQGHINANDTSGNLQPGSQQLSLYGVAGGSIPNVSVNQASTNIGGTTGSPYATQLKAASSAKICIASATTSQSGLFTIDSGLHVTLTIKDGTTC